MLVGPASSGQPSTLAQSPVVSVIWTAEGAAAARPALPQAPTDGLDAASALTELSDAALAKAFASYVSALHTPSDDALPAYSDPALAPRAIQAEQVLGALAASANQPGAVAEMVRMN